MRPEHLEVFCCQFQQPGNRSRIPKQEFSCTRAVLSKGLAQWRLCWEGRGQDCWTLEEVLDDPHVALMRGHLHNLSRRTLGGLVRLTEELLEFQEAYQSATLHLLTLLA